MITYLEGTVFNTDADAIVNTINCIGVMNTGVALEYGLRYPELLKEYEQKCKNKEISVGHIYYYKDKEKLIVNFPTKWHFKYPSKLEWIEDGLKDFVKTYKQYNIKSIAFTKLGTLNGGLDWNRVKILMEKYLNNLDIHVYICLDNKKDAEGLEKEMLNVFNDLSAEELKQNIRLTTKQLDILKQNMPINRFWKIKEIEGIGTTTYKSLFNYCKSQTEGKRFKQMNLFD
jgi:O-acetyl-ADP-ribose deacetylase (regulator of RNase III)